MLCRPCCCDAGMSEVWPFLQRWRGAHSTVSAIFDGAVLQVFAKDGQEDSTSLKPWHAPKHSRIAFTGLARATLNSHVKLYAHYIISMCLQMHVNHCCVVCHPSVFRACPGGQHQWRMALHDLGLLVGSFGRLVCSTMIEHNHHNQNLMINRHDTMHQL